MTTSQIVGGVRNPITGSIIVGSSALIIIAFLLRRRS